MAQPGGTSASIQSYLPVSEIREGVIVLKEGSLKTIIGVNPLNFGLKSDQEKNSVTYSYQSFLNSLEFPIQMLAVSRKLDLGNYMKEVKDLEEKEQDRFIKLQIQEYENFINALLAEINIMDKEFFVTVPYYPEIIGGKGVGLFPKKDTNQNERFEENVKAVQARTSQIIEGLSGIGLTCHQLDTEQIIELFYSLYNPDTAKNEKLSAVLNTMQNEVVEGGGAE